MTNLLKSKSYGFGKDHLWSLKRHPVITELGLEPPQSDVHTFRYEHEKLCAEVFVALYLSGQLHGWGQQRISKEVIPDRVFWLGDDLYYLEVEMGNQKGSIIRTKVEGYKKYWRETKENFQVRFITPDEKSLKIINQVVENESFHYQAYTLEILQKAVKMHSK